MLFKAKDVVNLVSPDGPKEARLIFEIIQLYPESEQYLIRSINSGLSTEIIYTVDESHIEGL